MQPTNVNKVHCKLNESEKVTGLEGTALEGIIVARRAGVFQSLSFYIFTGRA
jgi:hypothetical protein